MTDLLPEADQTAMTRPEAKGIKSTRSRTDRISQRPKAKSQKPKAKEQVGHALASDVTQYR
jgi:hypothetical protein